VPETLEDRMKAYEMAEAGRRFDREQPVCARIDGRSFSRWTRELAKPFDPRLSRAMLETSRYLLAESDARVAYTQSDEITLLFWSDEPKRSIFFDGRIQKMTSVLAALATVRFAQLAWELLPERRDAPATFDCRVWPLPSKVEAANVFLWREFDATRNSIEMATRAQYGHGEMMHRSTAEMLEMLQARGIDWAEYPVHFQRGRYSQRKKVLRRFTAEELAALPPKHEAHRDPDLQFERSVLVELELPPLSRVHNRVEVLFDGAEAVLT
jgi:tRNA(His) guanylyltransferase